MKKIDLKTILATAGAILLFGALFYFGGLSQAPAQNNNPAANGHNMGQNVPISLTALNNLVNKPAPEFSLLDRNGKTYSAASLRGKNTVLFFNEGLMCYPACWNQIVSLAKDQRFNNENTAAISIVIDSKEDWQQAVNKMPELSQATVIFDDNASVSNRFGAMAVPSSMHPGSRPGHTYVVLDKEGIVRYVFDDPNMAIRNDQLIAEIAKLK